MSVVIYTPTNNNIIYSSGVDSSATSGVLNTILTSVQIPANTFASGKRFRNDVRYTRTGTLLTGCTYRLYVNTSNSLSGATLIGTFTCTLNHQLATFVSNFVFKSSNTIQRVSSTFSLATDEGVGGLVLAITNFTFDSTVDNYLIFAGQEASGADTSLVSYLTILKY